MRFVRFFVILAALAVGLFSPDPSHGSGAVIGLPLDICILRARPDMTPRNLFAEPQRFDCTTPQRDFGDGDFWVMSQFLGNLASARGRNAVRIDNLWEERITLYALYPDGTIRGWPYDQRAKSRHTELGAMVQWSLPSGYGTPQRLLWRIEGSANIRGIIGDARLATRPEGARANLVMGSVYSAFGGLCAALLVYNLAMWAALRHRFQLAYCAMVIALGGYAFTSSGAIAWCWPDMPVNDRARLNYILLACTVSSALVFARGFFGDRVGGVWMTRLSNIFIAALGISTAAFVVLTPWHITLLDNIVSLCFAAILPLIVAIIWTAWRQKSPYLWLFSLAWLAPVLSATLRIGASLNLWPGSFWIDNSTIGAMACEAVISTLAVVYRIRAISRERDEARAHELAARMLADTDPLTGLLNRRAFLARATRRGGMQTLFLADLDHFKQVNETLGHDGGDDVLRVFARTLRASAPDSALVARIGGEEFAIIQPKSAAIDPEELLTRLRTARMPFDISVTASIGVCSGPLTNEVDWKRLYHCADRALYAAKAAGRDRARRADEVSVAA